MRPIGLFCSFTLLISNKRRNNSIKDASYTKSGESVADIPNSSKVGY